MVTYVGPERRRSQVERKRYAEENDMEESGTKIVFTPKGLAALILALLTAAGAAAGGGSMLVRSPGVADSRERERLAIVETKLDSLTALVDQKFATVNTRIEDNNQLLRSLVKGEKERR